MRATAAEPLPVIPGPGIHPDIDDATYFRSLIDPGIGATVTGLHVTQAKFLVPPSTPAHFKAAYEAPREEKKVFDFGHAAHLNVLGRGPATEIIPTTGWKTSTGAEAAPGWATKAAKDAVQAARDAGLVPLMPEDAAKLAGMTDALMGKVVALDLLTQSDAQAEVTLCGFDGQSDTWMLGKADLLTPSTILDYKTVGRLADPRSFTSVVAQFHYELQAAWYMELAAMCGAPREKFVFVAQEKTAPYEVAVYELSEEWLEIGREEMRNALDLFQVCIMSDIWPGYPDQVSILEAPYWARQTVSDDAGVVTESLAAELAAMAHNE